METVVTKRPRSAIISFDWSEVVSLVMVEGRWSLDCGVWSTIQIENIEA